MLLGDGCGGLRDKALSPRRVPFRLSSPPVPSSHFFPRLPFELDPAITDELRRTSPPWVDENFRDRNRIAMSSAAMSKKNKGKKVADPNETSKLLAAKISQLEQDAAGEKDQEQEIGGWFSFRL